LQQRLEQANQERKELEERAADKQQSLQDQINTIQSTLDSCQAQSSEERQQLEQQREELQSEITSLKARLGEEGKRLSELTETLEKGRAEARERIQGLEGEREQLKEKLSQRVVGVPESGNSKEREHSEECVKNSAASVFSQAPVHKSGLPSHAFSIKPCGVSVSSRTPGKHAESSLPRPGTSSTKSRLALRQPTDESSKLSTGDGPSDKLETDSEDVPKTAEPVPSSSSKKLVSPPCVTEPSEPQILTRSQAALKSPTPTETSKPSQSLKRPSPGLVASAKKMLLQSATKDYGASARKLHREEECSSSSTVMASAKKMLHLSEPETNAGGKGASKSLAFGRPMRVAKHSHSQQPQTSTSAQDKPGTSAQDKPGTNDSSATETVSAAALDSGNSADGGRKSPQGMMTRRRLSLTKRKSDVCEENSSGVSASKLARIVDQGMENLNNLFFFCFIISTEYMQSGLS
jgi:hypothetical protein